MPPALRNLRPPFPALHQPSYCSIGHYPPKERAFSNTFAHLSSPKFRRIFFELGVPPWFYTVSVFYTALFHALGHRVAVIREDTRLTSKRESRFLVRRAAMCKTSSAFQFQGIVNIMTTRRQLDAFSLPIVCALLYIPSVICISSRLRSQIQCS